MKNFMLIDLSDNAFSLHTGYSPYEDYNTSISHYSWLGYRQNELATFLPVCSLLL